MDELTRNAVNEFVDFLTKELIKHKHLTGLRIDKWSLKDFKVKIEFFVNAERKKLYFDVREIKENQHRLSHLLDNAFDQLNSQLTTKSKLL